MRGRVQQVCRQLVAFLGRHTAVALGAVATAVYLLTMDRSVSWWDCGEFIATGWLLQVGHPSGAPVYQLLSHLFMLLSFGNPMWVAPLSNAFSALCGGITVGLLFSTIRMLHPSGTRLGAAVGALCYLFCDTAWFSAVESEVYAPAMLFCSLEVWLALRWRHSRNNRLLLLIALLAGLGVGVHMMTLLALPAVLVAVVAKGPDGEPLRWKPLLRMLPLAVFLFLLGLTPYAIIPIRAAANPPINEGNPSSAESFAQYMRRDQYAKAPLYPRMWREKDKPNYHNWTFSDHGLAANAAYGVTYQLGYMYGRYLMYNFAGRMNLKHNIPVIFVLPALLGLWGMVRHRRRSKVGFWITLLLFLFGGVLLNFYLNHPCYEPRERDYAYVLSFYAFAVWIGVGASLIAKPKLKYLALLAPLLLAVGNWSDHDRHNCHSVHDIATAHLESCDRNAVLITLGDNDTFPLWYLQYVEGVRTDVDVINAGLAGWQEVMRWLNGMGGDRPVYVTHYFHDRFAAYFGYRFRCEGFCHRYLPDGQGLDDSGPLLRHMAAIEWHITDREYVDGVSRSMLKKWRQATAEVRKSATPAQ